MTPTLPPSTSINVRGGWVVYPMLSGYGGTWKVPSSTFDLTDFDIISYNIRFTNPYWYTLFIVSLLDPRPDANLELLITGPYNTDFALSGKITQWATAVEAESTLFDASYQSGVDPAGEGAIVLGSIVIRNNGDTIGVNQFQPIDGVNRGRSYIFYTQNLRCRWSV